MAAVLLAALPMLNFVSAVSQASVFIRMDGLAAEKVIGPEGKAATVEVESMETGITYHGIQRADRELRD